MRQHGLLCRVAGGQRWRGRWCFVSGGRGGWNGIASVDRTGSGTLSGGFGFAEAAGARARMPGARRTARRAGLRFTQPVFLEHVERRRRELRAVADQRVAACASGAWIGFGIANTSRPSSFASRAVISERARGSTTSAPIASAAISRLRWGGRRGRRAERPFRHDRAVRGDLVGERAVPRRVDEIGAGRDHRDRARPVRAPRCAAASRSRARGPIRSAARRRTVRVRSALRPRACGVAGGADHGETARIRAEPRYI